VPYPTMKKKEPLAYGSGQWKGCIINLPQQYHEGS
jgi:hypothetical protein